MRGRFWPRQRACQAKHHPGAHRSEYRHADEGVSVVTLPLPDAGDRLRTKRATQCIDQDDRSQNASIKWSAVMGRDQNLDAGKSAAEPEPREHGIAVKQCVGADRHLAKRNQCERQHQYCTRHDSMKVEAVR